MTAFLTACALTRPRISVRKSSRRSDHRRPPRATKPNRRCTPSTRGEYTKISNRGRGSGSSSMSPGLSLNDNTFCCARRVRAGDEVVGAQRRLDHRRECAQHAVGVQADQRIDVGGDGGGGGLRVARSCSSRRASAGSNSASNSSTSDRAVPALSLSTVSMWDWLYGKAGLPQVFRVGAQHGDLLPGQTGAQHQLVEAVDLGAAVPDRGDGVGEARGGGLDVRALAPPGSRCGET